jgi:hypothetical protein
MPLLVSLVILPTLAHAAPCLVSDVAVAGLRAALHRTSAVHVLPAPSLDRWRAALPVRMSAGIHNGSAVGDAWYLGNTLTERTSNTTSLGFSVRFEWDLRPLFAKAPTRLGPTPSERLQHALHTEELARRVATQLARLRKAQALATQAQDGDYVCADAQADAEAALLVLGAITTQP